MKYHFGNQWASSASLWLLVLFAANSAHLEAQGLDPDSTAAVRLERTPCFGLCMAYQVELDSRGMVRFTGLEQLSGRIDSVRIDPDSVRLLAAEFTEAGFFGFDSAYVAGTAPCGVAATDMPSAILTLRWRGRTKRVQYYYGCTGLPSDAPTDSLIERTENPRGVLGVLARLAKRVDMIAHTSRWLSR